MLVPSDASVVIEVDLSRITANGREQAGDSLCESLRMAHTLYGTSGIVPDAHLRGDLLQFTVLLPEQDAIDLGINLIDADSAVRCGNRPRCARDVH